MRLVSNRSGVIPNEDGFLEAHARDVVARLSGGRLRALAGMRPDEVVLAPGPEIEARLDVRRADLLRELLVRFARERLARRAA